MSSDAPSRIHLFLLLIAALLLGLSSILSLIFKSAAFFPRKDFILLHGAESSYRHDIKTSPSLPMFPTYLDDGAIGPVLGSGFLCLFLSLIAVILVSASLRKGPLLMVTRSPIFILSILLVQYLFSLGALIHTFLIHHLSAHFEPSHRANPYDHGIFDPETWTCEIYSWHSSMGREVSFLHRQCIFEEASRWALIPVLILSTGFGVFAVLAIVAERAIIIARKKTKNFEVDVAYDYDSPSVYSR
ncbi:hypothetical protein CISG_08843 [Coccidioides immitis RMSCC 3703]|uniref:Uncharacterized protein n=3 Tax=Coccidioides immitis TaxID=5501 RepID=A0A0J8R7K4_COCIT|nr:hypothetical protein CIRG_05104 [Coccidioides immitis RMSCC 2394]KMU80994.1 hypothetical protein CISG_08843 [Coccidioides immitis RMSCC 3703]